MPGGAELGSGVGGGIADLAILLGYGGKGGTSQYKEAVNVWKKLKAVNFDMSKLSPPEQRVVATLIPQQASADVSGPVSVAQDSPQTREAQIGALAQLGRLSQTGTDLPDQLAAQEAQRAMLQGNRRITGSALSNLAARGLRGGGSELSARFAGGERAAELGRGMGSDLAQAAAQRRLAAINSLGQLGGSIRGQDIGLSQSQAAARNAYAEWVSNLRTNVNQQNAQQGQEAALWNARNRQGAANQNTQAAYANTVRNQEYPNEVRQQGFQNEVARTQGLSGALAGYGQALDNQRLMKQLALKGAGQSLGGLAGGGLGAGFGL